MSNEQKLLHCPACERELRAEVWLTCEGGHYKDSNYYECDHCGVLPKEFIDKLIYRTRTDVSRQQDAYTDMTRYFVKLYPVTNTVTLDPAENGSLVFYADAVYRIAALCDEVCELEQQLASAKADALEEMGDYLLEKRARLDSPEWANVYHAAQHIKDCANQLRNNSGE